MQTLAPAIDNEISNAQRLAGQYWETNHRALSRTQPDVATVLEDARLDHEWVFGRDGSISGLENGRWWADCSVPLLAGRSLLRPLSDEAIGSCQLAPFHAGLVRAALERMGKIPVLFIAQPDVRVARMILSSHDFSEQIENHRLWLVTGTNWLGQFEQIFNDHPGLATPMRFIRTELTPDEITQPMIKAIQDVFSKVLSVRGDEILKLRTQPRRAVNSKTMLVIGGSEFRLWDFGARVVHQQLRSQESSGGLTIQPFDMDDALSGSPLALLRASQSCNCVVAVNVSRADCNQLIPQEIPWITWMTHIGVPPFQSAGPRDELILADGSWKAIATATGWPADRVKICGWPAVPLLGFFNDQSGSDQSGSSLDTNSHTGDAIPAAGVLGMICDTRKICVPTAVADFSSHRLLWELIEEELAENPLAVEDVQAYLTNRAGQLNIPADLLDREKFIEQLIIPAYQQGLARLLISGGISIRLWGKGWGQLPEFSTKFAGAISTTGEMQQAIGSCRGLIYCWPEWQAHAMQMFGKPIVYRSGTDRSALIRFARSTLGGFDPGRVTARDESALANMILQWTNRTGQ